MFFYLKLIGHDHDVPFVHVSHTFARTKSIICAVSIRDALLLAVA